MFFCGIDVGTTNTKAVLVDGSGGILDSALITNHNEINMPSNWIDYFHRILKKLKAPKKSEIACCFATQGGSFIFLDSSYRPISKVYSWTELADRCQAENLREVFGTNGFYSYTGWQPDEWLACCKIRQLIKNRYSDKSFEHIAFVPEFINSQLFGKFITDATNAQITGLFDFNSKSWDQKFCDWAKIQTCQLAKISIKPEIIHKNLVMEGYNVSFTTSIHDQYAAMAALNLEKDKEVMLATGTAWVLNVRTKKPLFDNAKNIMHPGYDIMTGN